MSEIYDNFEDLIKIYSEAEGQRVQLQEFRKCKKALLMKEAQALNNKLSSVAQETEAYAHPDYQQIVEGIGTSTTKALAAKWRLILIQMKSDNWRTKESTKRAEMNLR